MSAARRAQAEGEPVEQNVPPVPVRHEALVVGMEVRDHRRFAVDPSRWDFPFVLGGGTA
ncbi:hypothetical protein OHA77_06865 [Streptosporangium sp. NBC_01639]|uniref:hypothetical protein n=1 Tax=Streptosporangium sp. NBC_01639 TaxID=2975948 RepID=UPI003868D5CB|nr:hypothetical protein OHA77_06865 [Streptosporangium sp. NBC_01639]